MDKKKVKSTEKVKAAESKEVKQPSNGISVQKGVEDIDVFDSVSKPVKKVNLSSAKEATLDFKSYLSKNKGRLGKTDTYLLNMKHVKASLSKAGTKTEGAWKVYLLDKHSVNIDKSI